MWILVLSAPMRDPVRKMKVARNRIGVRPNISLNLFHVVVADGTTLTLNSWAL